MATIIGTSRHDSLDGTTGADLIRALQGDDYIGGSAGNDLIYTGDGWDMFSWYINQGTDRISFGAGGGRIDWYATERSLELIDSISLSFSASTKTYAYVFSTSVGSTLINTNRPQSSDLEPDWAFTRLATFEGNFSPWVEGPYTDGNDLMVGRRGNIQDQSNPTKFVTINENEHFDAGAGNDLVYANGGSDTVYGGSGEDYIGTGIDDGLNDLFDGGSGIDTVSYTSAKSSTTIDLARGTARGQSIGNDKALNFENAVGSKYADRLVGTDAINELSGGAGADTLIGGKGDDLLIGGTGDDVFYVDSKYDRVEEAANGGTADLIYTSISHTLANYVEKLYAVSSTSSLNLTGNSLANIIKGNAGNDRVNGGAGVDTLYGGSGKDTFVFTTKASSSNYDKVVDYSTAYDTIWLDDRYFSKLGSGSTSSPEKISSSSFVMGPKAKDKNDYLVYDKTKGYLYYDADGSGSGKATLVAIFSNKADLKYSEFYII